MRKAHKGMGKSRNFHRMHKGGSTIAWRGEKGIPSKPRTGKRSRGRR